MMTDERTKVFLLLDEAEKRQKTAEQQQAALKDLLQASQTAKAGGWTVCSIEGGMMDILGRNDKPGCRRKTP